LCEEDATWLTPSKDDELKIRKIWQNDEHGLFIKQALVNMDED
jgi:hypothetical protein